MKHIARGKQSSIIFSSCDIKKNKEAFCSFLSPEFSLRSQISAEACCKQNMTLPITSEYSTSCMQMESRSDGCREHLAASAGAVAARADQSVAEKAEAMKKGETAVKSSEMLSCREKS